MHSSRMRTGRSLTVCRSLLPAGWGGIPAFTEADTPPPANRMTDTSKIITLATTSLRPVIKYKLNHLSFPLGLHECTFLYFVLGKFWPGPYPGLVS